MITLTSQLRIIGLSLLGLASLTSSSRAATLAFDFQNITGFTADWFQTVSAVTFGPEPAAAAGDVLNASFDTSAMNGFVFTGPPTANRVSSIFVSNGASIDAPNITFSLDSFAYANNFGGTAPITVEGVLGASVVWSFTTTATTNETIYATTTVGLSKIIDSIRFTNGATVNNVNRFDNFVVNTTPVPEPTSSLLAVCAVGFSLLRRRRRE